MNASMRRTSLGWLLASMMVGSMAMAQEFDPAGPVNESDFAPGDPAQASVEDRAFSRYIDLGDLVDAWTSLDPEALTDVALQLAEGERILMRSHRSGITSDQLLEIAVRVAVEAKSTDTLKRLERVAAERGNSKLAERVGAAEKLASVSRDPDSKSMVSADSLSLKALAEYQGVVTAIRAAKISGSHEALASLEDSLASLKEISDAQREALASMISEAKGEIGDQPLDAAAALDKLSATSRQWPTTIGPGVPGPWNPPVINTMPQMSGGYWDPYSGQFITSTRSTQIHGSAFEPWRNFAQPGSQQWVDRWVPGPGGGLTRQQGFIWRDPLGREHGNLTETTRMGDTEHSTRRLYSRAPN